MTSLIWEAGDVARARRPDPLPLATNDMRTAFVMTGLWLAALVTVLLLRATNAYDVGDLWVWVCVAGVGLGILGTPLVATQQRRIARDTRRARKPAQLWPNGSADSSSVTEPGPGSGVSGS